MLREVDLPKEETTPYPETGHGGYSKEENAAMQRAVLNLFDRWEVTDREAAVILGGIASKTFARWRKGEYGRVNRDLSDRMSHLLGVHKALRVIFTKPEMGYAWVKAPNKTFGGISALELLLRGGMDDLVRLRRYLDAERGGW